MIAPTTGPSCWRSVCRVMMSVMVRSTSGCSCTVGLVSDARVLDTSGFCEPAAMTTVISALQEITPQKSSLSEVIAAWWCCYGRGRQARGASIRQSSNEPRGRPVVVPRHVLTRFTLSLRKPRQRHRDFIHLPCGQPNQRPLPDRVLLIAA